MSSGPSSPPESIRDAFRSAGIAFAEFLSTITARLADDYPIRSFGGTIRYVDFVETRVTELTLHLTDLQRALDRPEAVPAIAAAVVRASLLTVRPRLDDLTVITGLTGRRQLNVYA